jgi:hypothetical protein
MSKPKAAVNICVLFMIQSYSFLFTHTIRYKATVNHHAAGIDMGSKEMVVTYTNPDGRICQFQSGCFTKDLDETVHILQREKSYNDGSYAPKTFSLQTVIPNLQWNSRLRRLQGVYSSDTLLYLFILQR